MANTSENTEETTEEHTDKRAETEDSEGRAPRKTAPRKTTARKAAPRKAPPRRAAPRTESDEPPPRKRPGVTQVLRHAREQLVEVTGLTVESVSSFERNDEGWHLNVEVLELERVPDTMSLLASYEVELDDDGELVGYRRLRRYERGRADRT
ncbi:gas vesicle protein [Streptomyces sp. NPDC001941]|uniref:gas vesicle protein GvpO n=1 Tax=Streptomyces sp. NPDC001941 TaxID=3154659 RepID=UPI00332B0BE8